MDTILQYIGDYTPLFISAFKAILFLLVGYIVAGAAKRIIKKQVAKHGNLDETIGNFAASIVRWLILAIVGIAVLQLFGFQATSLVAILGASTLAIGLALQGTLSDVASGIMLIAFRPYKIGQYVDIDGNSGTVKEVSLFTTELVTPDNVQIIMPNSKAWGAIITNFSAHSTRRVDLVFGIDYNDNADDAMNIITDVLNANDCVLKTPEIWMKVTNLGDSSVDITVRAWANAEDYWDVKFDTLKAVKEAFDAHNISIPYPHQVEIIKDVSD